MITKKLIAVLRGITPQTVLSVAKTIVFEGIDCCEVTLNSPNAFESIKILVDNQKILDEAFRAGIQSRQSQTQNPILENRPLNDLSESVSEKGVLIGAGTVLTTKEVQRVFDCGAKLIVSPNTDPSVIKKSKELDMISLPGSQTTTECFSALHSGADGIKIFPASLVTPSGVKAIAAVLPKNLKLFAVSGFSPEEFVNWKEAGVYGFGIGSYLYKPEKSNQQIREQAKKIFHHFSNLES